MKILKPPSPLQFNHELPGVFLAGSIEMGKATDWQSSFASQCSDLEIVVYNPRRDAWDDSWVQRMENPVFRQQVEWELKAQEMATLVVFYFSPGSNFRPYVGVGLNYTKFFHESTKGGVLGDLGLKPKIDSTTGLSFQIGFDFDVSDTLILNVDYRKIDIEPDAELFTESTGVTFLAFDAPLNPSVFMVQLAMKF